VSYQDVIECKSDIIDCRCGEVFPPGVRSGCTPHQLAAAIQFKRDRAQQEVDEVTKTGRGITAKLCEG
jgi:hypothetical protein